ncbi:hypothetical protein [Mycobacterium sp. NPDC050041]|uniref:hypothetical protein n=1 Tax=Mycobacterium sp. NPDC050041 TaxID=3364293 RepID=UPI003C2E075B
MRLVRAMRDRVTLALVAAAMIGVGFLGLYWSTSLDDFDQWGFRITCGSGFAADYSQAATADAEAAAAETPPAQTDYVGRCRSAIWLRRGWTASLMSIGVALSIALLLNSRERVDAATLRSR